MSADFAAIGQRWLREGLISFDGMYTWQPNKEGKPSITCVPSDVGNICFSFLDDEDLLRASSTSLTFLKAYYKYFRASRKNTGHDVRSIISLAKLGYTFPSITHLNLSLPYKSPDFQYLSPTFFPSLQRLHLNYICVHMLPVHPKVTFLRLEGCSYFGRENL